MKEDIRPYVIEVAANSVTLLCGCGTSDTPPYCHSRGCSNPEHSYEYYSRRNRILLICSCDQTNKLPFCDGSHCK